MKYRSYLLAFALISASSVSTYFVTTNFSAVPRASAQQAAAAVDNDYQIGPILFMQKAAEYRALTYQAFNIAKTYLDADNKAKKKLPKAERKKTRAVVVDVDETVLDNSPHQAWLIKNGKSFNGPDWTMWCEKRSAKAIPGALDFLNYAARQGNRVFYVTNRNQAEKASTIDNLRSAGFPDVSEETVMTRETESTKEPRRQKIMEKHRIVILMGDNLSDITQAFERKSVADRFAEVDKVREMWGGKFIVLPNAMYGEWENAVYEYKRLTESEKAAKRLDAMETF
jgi:5'-nucleotidase (lipoprotein e(P4) family)